MLKEILSTKYLYLTKRYNMKIRKFNELVNFPKEISINQFLDYYGTMDNVQNGWVDMPHPDIVDFRSNSDKLIEFSKTDIDEVLNLKSHLQESGYQIYLDEKSIRILDTDIDRLSINPNSQWTAKKVGNFDDIWIYKLVDEWFLISLQRSNIIPYHKNLHYLRNRNSGFKFFKCDQIDEVTDFLISL